MDDPRPGRLTPGRARRGGREPSVADHRIRALHLAGFFWDTAAEPVARAIRSQLELDDTTADRRLILRAAETFGPRGHWPASVERTVAWYDARPDVADRADAYAIVARP